MTAMNLRLPTRWRRARYPLAIALCTTTMLAALPLRDQLNIANIDMLFLLTVFAVAIALGRGPAVMAALLGVALFDFFFVPPFLSFAVADAQYLVTFGVMLTVGLITSHLAAQLAERTEQAQASAQETMALYEVARTLGGALSTDQVAGITRAFLHQHQLDATLLIAEAGTETDFQAYGQRPLSAMEWSFARSAFVRQCVIEADSLADTGIAIAFVPLNAPSHVRGVLAVGALNGDAEQVRRQRPMLEALASLVALIVERLLYAAAAQQSEMQIAAERLRSSILASLSHDLRTPLTSLVGLADTLAQPQPQLTAAVAETAGIIRDQAHAMHHLLSNLLEMARLQSGGITLNKEWQPFVEVVGSSTRLLADSLATRQLEIDIPADLPLVCFDAVLMERVVCNLLENAVKYSPAGARIHLQASTSGGQFALAVCNAGAAFPADRLDQVFELFVRGAHEAPTPGTGMGLAICKAIITAHQGCIVAENHLGEACVRFTLPLGTPPTLADEGAP